MSTQMNTPAIGEIRNREFVYNGSLRIMRIMIIPIVRVWWFLFLSYLGFYVKFLYSN